MTFNEDAEAASRAYIDKHGRKSPGKPILGPLAPPTTVYLPDGSHEVLRLAKLIDTAGEEFYIPADPSQAARRFRRRAAGLGVVEVDPSTIPEGE